MPRLLVVAVVALLVALVQAAVPPPPSPAGDARSLVSAVDAIGMTVASVERSIAFYAGVLGFETVADTEGHGEAGLRMRVVRMRLGDETIALTEYLAPRGGPIPADSRSHDRWFQHVAIVVSDMDRAYAELRRHGVEHISPAPQRLPDWNPNAGGIRAFYFKDPDGHPLELIWFPAGKGDVRWQQPGRRLFLGIDHTPIDLTHWQTTLVTSDARGAVRALRGSACRALSPDAVATPDRALGFSRGFLVRDPDAHALAIVER